MIDLRKREGAIGVLIIASLLSLLLLTFMLYGCGGAKNGNNVTNGNNATDGGTGTARLLFFTQPG